MIETDYECNFECSCGCEEESDWIWDEEIKCWVCTGCATTQ